MNMEEELKQQETETPKKKKKGLRTTGEILFWIVIVLFASFFVWNGIDQMSGYKAPIFGLRTSVIVSPSMEIANPDNTYLDNTMKRIKKYDVITTMAYKSYDEIKLYDVITYTSQNGLICHRVIDKYEADGQKYIVTRGDSNNVNDTPINYSLVRGKVILVTPGVGRVLLFVQSPYFLIGFFGSAFFILLGYYIFKNGKGKKKDKTPALETNGGAIENKPIENVSKEEKVYTPTVSFEEASNEIWPQLNDPKPLPKEENKTPIKEEKAKAVTPKKETTKVKPAKKSEPKHEKKEEKAKPEPVKEKPVKKEETKIVPVEKASKQEEKKDVGFRVYHVNKRKEDGKWTVKYAGGEKVIKLFDTQKEALEYANQMAKNQDGTVLVHASKGVNKGKIIKK